MDKTENKSFKLKIVFIYFFGGGGESRHVKNTEGVLFFVFKWKQNCKVQQLGMKRDFFCLAYASFCPPWQQEVRRQRVCWPTR